MHQAQSSLSFTRPTFVRTLNRVASLLALTALLLGPSACTTIQDDDSDDPIPIPRSSSAIAYLNLVVPVVNASSSQSNVSFSFTSDGERGGLGGSLPYGSTRNANMEWYRSDSTNGRVTYRVSQGASLASGSQLVSRTTGHWFIAMGSNLPSATKPFSLMQMPYVSKPADTTQRTFAYVHASPAYPQIKVLYNGTELATVNYGQVSQFVAPFRTNTTDVLSHVNAANNQVIYSGQIGTMFSEPVNLVTLRQFDVRLRSGADSVFYRHAVYGQE